MISSLVLTGMFDIGIDKNEKYSLNGERTAIKDVPFIRYRFSEYGEEQIAYIKKMQGKFHYSTHMAEVMLSEKAQEQLKVLADTFDNIAVYLYVPITDEMVTAGIDENTEELLETIKNEAYDRIMIRDNTETLHLVSANMLKRQVAEVTAYAQADIGICNSPLSYGNEACLSALTARNLTAMYSASEECAIPSSNHECMNTCGCIRYVLVESDIPTPIGKGPSEKKSNSGKKTGTSGSKKKVSKAPLEW